MATTKTLTPTNETITIDAFQGEKPDHRHVADAEAKLADAVNALNSNMANKPDIEVGSWTPDLPRDTISDVYATYVRIGRLLFITAQFNNVHGTGVSYINYNSFPIPTGYRQAYGFHGSWVSDTSDTIGACGQFSENKNFRFATNGAATALPSEPISFNAVCSLQPTT